VLIGPLRLALGAAFLVGADAAGAETGPALVLFAVGALALVFLLFNDPRAPFRRAAHVRAPLPDTASVAPAWLHAAHAALPSTVGVSALAAVALWGRPDVAALLAGMLAGLGIAALLSAFRVDPGLYVEPHTGSVFLKR